MIGQTSFPCAKCYRNCGEEEDHLLFTGGGGSPKVGQMAAVLTRWCATPIVMTPFHQFHSESTQLFATCTSPQLRLCICSVCEVESAIGEECGIS